MGDRARRGRARALDGRPRLARTRRAALRNPPLRGVFSLPWLRWTRLKRSGRSTARRGDQHLRDRLILTYAPLVKFVAGRVGASLPAHVDEQDLVSYGLLGLIGAIERFDPEREIKFETFAMARIRGAIIDELRSLDWVPRSVRTRARQIERAIAGAREGAHARADRRGDREEARGDERRARGEPARDLPHVGRGARRALVAVRQRRPDRPDRHDRGRVGPGPGVLARADRDQGGARRGDLGASRSARSSS